MQNIFGWINRELEPALSNSEEFMYDDMASQSGRCLPIIYQEFDPNKRSHWCDRGAILDFYYSTGEGKILYFGRVMAGHRCFWHRWCKRFLVLMARSDGLKNATTMPNGLALIMLNLFLSGRVKNCLFEDNSFRPSLVTCITDMQRAPRRIQFESKNFFCGFLLYRVTKPKNHLILLLKLLNGKSVGIDFISI